MSDVSALDAVVERLKQATTRASASFFQIEKTFQKTAVSISEIAASAGARLDAVRVANVDVTRVKALLAAGDIAALTPSEAKYVARMFLGFSPDALGKLLRAQPRLWRLYLRAMLSRWEASLDDTGPWLKFATLAKESPTGLVLVEGPVAIGELVGKYGPTLAARATKTANLLSCYRRLIAWRFSRGWSLTSFALIAWIREASTNSQVLGKALALLCTDPEHEILRNLLLPETGMDKTRSPLLQGGTALSRQHGVAGLLRARFDSPYSLTSDAFSAVETRLLHGEFGDPRAPVGESWDRVGQLATSAYQTYRQSLIREDVIFFFRQAMQEKDRELFWLKYVGAAVRTICVLDPGIHRQLALSLANAPMEMRAALKRCAVAHRTVQGSVSAFCLVFEKIVVVEFSLTGNAAYIYDRSFFERELLPLILRRQLGKTSDLRDYAQALTRIIHMSRWESEAMRILAEHGVPRPPLAKSTAY